MLGRLRAFSAARRKLLLASMALAPIAVACGLFDELPPVPTPTPTAANIIQNPGFESGNEPWRALDQPTWRPFSIGDSQARSGGHALELNLTGEPADTNTRIVGAMQPVAAPQFPEYVSGFYRVDDWQANATFQYLQFVVIVRGGDFGDGVPVHEVRFPIAGIDREPFTLSNARFLFLSREAPVVGKWTYFGYPVKQAFQSRLGKVPASWDSIEVFFEVRYDGKTAEQGITAAHVYYDDLYAGPQIDNPNHPSEDP